MCNRLLIIRHGCTSIRESSWYWFIILSTHVFVRVKIVVEIDEVLPEVLSATLSLSPDQPVPVGTVSEPVHPRRSDSDHHQVSRSQSMNKHNRKVILLPSHNSRIVREVADFLLGELWRRKVIGQIVKKSHLKYLWTYPTRISIGLNRFDFSRTKENVYMLRRPDMRKNVSTLRGPLSKIIFSHFLISWEQTVANYF